ncbi:unnamed protein product, partial [Phaeothamnion confervicola]
PLLREEEISRLPGSFWFLLGVAGAAAAFPEPVAVMSELHLAVGDPAAAVVGSLFGASTRCLPREKSLAGFAAAAAACAAVTGALVGGGILLPTGMLANAPMVAVAASLYGGLCGAVAEAWPWGVDDNLSMPLVSGGLFSLFYATLV